MKETKVKEEPLDTEESLAPGGQMEADIDVSLNWGVNESLTLIEQAQNHEPLCSI